MTKPGGHVRLATRGSPLALAQVELVARLLAEASDGRVTTELVVVETSGDKRADVPIHAIGGEGVFSKEVDAAVATGRADAAVHSAKDLPSLPPGEDGMLPIVAVLERGDPRDALVGRRLDELAPGAPVATGSVRRRAQIAWMRPDLVFKELRGNVGTRLSKVPPNGAAVVAAAALERLGWAPRAAQLFSPRELLPQVGQATIAICGRGDDEKTSFLMTLVEHAASRLALEAERSYLSSISGGCEMPVGAYATVSESGEILLQAMIASLDGHSLVRTEKSGSEASELGRNVARQLLDDCGGTELIFDLRPAGP